MNHSLVFLRVVSGLLLLDRNSLWILLFLAVRVKLALLMCFCEFDLINLTLLVSSFVKLFPSIASHVSLVSLAILDNKDFYFICCLFF